MLTRRSSSLFFIVALFAMLATILLVPAPLTSTHVKLELAQSRPTDTRTEPITTPRQAFDALQAQAGGTLKVTWHETTAIPRFLAGQTPAARIPYTPTPAEHGNPLAIARGFLDSQRTLFQLTSVDHDLRLLRIEPDRQLNYSHVRLEQHYHGLPVFGRQLVVHIDSNEQIVAVNGEFAPGIQVATTPTISAAAAETTALRDLLDVQLTPAERLRVQTEVLSAKTHPIVYVDQQNHATLTWQVTIMTTAPLGQWRYFVNAGRPAVVAAFDSLNNAKFRRTFTAGNTTRIPGRLLIEEGERTRNQIAQAAHDNAGVVYDYYFNTFQRDSIDDRGMPIVSTVNFGSDPQDADNAAWVGEAQQMIYGDGGQIFRPLAYGLDIVAHELTHGVIDNTSQLIYQGQSGALNEAFADIFGVLAAKTDWTVGGGTVKSPPYPVPILRSLKDPTLGGRYNPRDPLGGVGQPGEMSQYANLPLSRRADNGGVHINGGIPARAAYLVNEAIGTQKMEQIFYRSMVQYLTPDANFLVAGQTIARAAQDLYGQNEANAVRQAFATVGLNLGGNESGPSAPPTESRPRTPSQPAPTENLPAGCTNVVVNGGFESNAGWTEVETKDGVVVIDTELPRTGARSAWLGGIDTEPLQFVFQDVTIPANTTSVRLSYWRLVVEEKRGLFAAFTGDATFGAYVANNRGDIVSTFEEISSRGGDNTWRQVSFDLSRLAGKSFRLVFASENPPGNISSMFVDDVVLQACTGGSSAPAPSAPSAPDNQVFLRGRITDADTGRGVDGAQVFIMRPGVSATQASADDTLTRDEVLTIGTADASGAIETEEAVPRGATYSVIVYAGGYRPIIADDGLRIPADAKNPYPISAKLRRGR
jgi:Zn-dependent metalloprotease